MARVEPLFPELLPRERLAGPVVVLAAHPDDETIGCGGLLAWHAAAGHRVVVVHATDGGGGDPQGRFGDVGRRRRAEVAAALQELGVRERRELGFRDGALAETPELADRLAAALAEVAPRTVYTLSPLDSHPDHRVLARAAALAIGRACPPDTVCMIFGVNNMGLPNTLVDITDRLEVKERALRRFDSQLAYIDFAAKVMWRDRAATVNIEDRAVAACEAFMRLPASALAAFCGDAARIESRLYQGRVASRTGEPPAVAAVVVHYGPPGPTLACLEDLAAVAYPALAVVVVDNDPAGELAAALRARRPGWTVLAPGANLGYCRAVNAGVQAALGGGAEYLLLLNNDVRLPPDSLKPLVEALEADPAAASAGPLVLDPAGRIWSAGGVYAFGPSVTRLRGHGRREGRRFAVPAAVDYLPGACVLHRAAALPAGGPLDEGYWMYMEDLDLAARLAAGGWRSLYVPWSRVVHDPSRSTGGGISPRRKYLTALNSVRFLRRHGTPRRWLAFWLCDALGLPAAALLWLARGRGLAPALAKARGLWAGLRGRQAGEER